MPRGFPPPWSIEEVNMVGNIIFWLMVGVAGFFWFSLIQNPPQTMIENHALTVDGLIAYSIPLWIIGFGWLCKRAFRGKSKE